jgi:hypothetical protein
MRRFLVSVAVVSLSGLIAACGGSTSESGAGGGGAGGGGGGSVDRSKFVGVWVPSTGRNAQVTCPSIGSFSAPFTDSLEWKLGDGSGLVGSIAGCSLKASVANNVATVTPGQVCELTSPYTMSVTFSNYVFTLNADGTTASDTSTGTGRASVLGQTLDCQYSATTQYAKKAN